MTIILDEKEWVEDHIRSLQLGNKPYDTLCRVAKYYAKKMSGCTKKDIRKHLELFLIQCDPTASIPKWSDALDFAVNKAFKSELINIPYIAITKPEMEIIDAIEGKQMRRLAFTLLCLAKYWDIVNTKCDHWVNNKDNEIMRMANINTSIKRQSMMYHSLNELGLIRFSKKIDNTNVRVEFITDGEEVLKIKDFVNLGYQYLKYHGEPYFECENCHTTVKLNDKNGRRPPKYCSSCALEIHMQQKINSVMRNRSLNPKQEEYTVYMHLFPDKKKYIGLTGQKLSARWKNGIGYKGYSVGGAIEKCGWENIRHFLLYKGSNKEYAKLVESYYINKFNTYDSEFGYNSNGIKPNVELRSEINIMEVDDKGVIINK